MKLINLVIVFLQFAIVSALYGQKLEAMPNPEQKCKNPYHSISITIGHTHIPKGVISLNKNEALIVPSWGLNYVFHFNEKWAVGWLNDMEIATYVIEVSDQNDVERERPLITSLVGIFRPRKQIGVFAGFGREFEKHQNYWVFRLGVEIEIEIDEAWAILPSLTYDIKETKYDSWAIGLSVARRL